MIQLHYGILEVLTKCLTNALILLLERVLHGTSGTSNFTVERLSIVYRQLHVCLMMIMMMISVVSSIIAAQCRRLTVCCIQYLCRPMREISAAAAAAAHYLRAATYAQCPPPAKLKNMSPQKCCQQNIYSRCARCAPRYQKSWSRLLSMPIAGSGLVSSLLLARPSMTPASPPLSGCCCSGKAGSASYTRKRPARLTLL